MHWLIEGEQRRMLKESGPLKYTSTAEETKKDMIRMRNRVVQGQLFRMVKEYGEVSPKNLP